MRHAIVRWALGLALATSAAGAQAALKVYDATQLSYDRYTVIKRLWADSWRTAFGVPHHATREAAVEDILQAAESAGADAVVNLYCVGGTPSLSGYYCYGEAVKLKAKPGASR